MIKNREIKTLITTRKKEISGGQLAAVGLEPPPLSTCTDSSNCR
jgi:hypothetical protein